MTEQQQIKVEVDGQVVAEALVSAPDEHAQARAQVHVEPGQLPGGSRRLVAEAVHEAVVGEDAQRLSAALPRGDAELVEEMRQHLDDAQLRAAGASSILEGEVRRG